MLFTICTSGATAMVEAAHLGEAAALGAARSTDGEVFGVVTPAENAHVFLNRKGAPVIVAAPAAELLTKAFGMKQQRAASARVPVPPSNVIDLSDHLRCHPVKSQTHAGQLGYLDEKAWMLELATFFVGQAIAEHDASKRRGITKGD